MRTVGEPRPQRCLCFLDQILEVEVFAAADVQLRRGTDHERRNCLAPSVAADHHRDSNGEFAVDGRPDFVFESQCRYFGVGHFPVHQFVQEHLVRPSGNDVT